MILVAGGTGRLGTLVVAGLARRGLEVRVLTRQNQEGTPVRSGGLKGVASGVSYVTGDVRDPSTLPAALVGVDLVVSAVHGFAGTGGDSPATVDRDGNQNLVDAAKAASTDFVLLSGVGAAPDSPMELFRMKHAAERTLHESGIAGTVVRPTAFLELWIEILRKTAARSGRPLIFGRGDNAINFVSVADVAEVVQRVVVDRATRGQTYEVGGPENLTFNQLAAAVQHADGRTGAPRHVPPAVLRMVAASIGRVKPVVGRQTRAALVMDRMDLTFAARGENPFGVASTSVAEVLTAAP